MRHTPELTDPINTTHSPDSPLPMSAAQFYKEILATYRVIFGQDKRSINAYRKRVSSWGTWTRRSTQCLARGKPPFGDNIIEDTLVHDLCGKNWRKQAVYYHVDMDLAKVTYQASGEFPFFSQRLLELQDFVLTQEPDSWATLWHDRRNIERHWAFWGFIYFSLLTLVIGLLQAALALAQVLQQKA